MTYGLFFAIIHIPIGEAFPKIQTKEAVFALMRKQLSVMKTLIRVLALVLACLFCLSMVVACKDKTKTTTGTKSGKSNKSGSEGLFDEEDTYTWDANTGKYVDKWGKEKDDLPEDLDFGGTDVVVLYWSDVEKPEFISEELTDNERMQAIYYRNRAIQNRLGVELKFEGVRGDHANIKKFVAHVAAAFEAGTHDFDLIATYSRTAGALMVKGYLVDLNTIENSYLTVGLPEGQKKPWWPKNLTENMAIGNKQFMVAGDISMTIIDEMYATYFNKELVNVQFEEEARAAGVEDGTRLLYSYVRSGTWTLDKMIEMMSNYYVDNDHNNRRSIGDRFSLCSANNNLTLLYGGLNFRMLQPDPSQILKLSPDITSNRVATAVQKLGRLLTSNEYYDRDRDSVIDGVFYMDPFIQGECMFTMHYLECAENFLLNNDAVPHYGLVPTPRYDVNQPFYYSVVGYAFSMFCIFQDFNPHDNAEETLSMLTAVIECWASEGYRKCTPVLFELNMQLKYSETQDETDMCEYLRAGIVFDLGRVMEDALGGARFDTKFILACIAGQDWASQVEGIWNAAEASLAGFLRTNFGDESGT